MPLDSISSTQSSSSAQETPGIKKIMEGVQSGEIKPEDVKKAANLPGIGCTTDCTA
jgi:hypothetical protein